MKRAVEYAVTCCVCAAIAVAVIFLRGVLKVDDVNGVMRCLSDGFFVAGVFSLACGGLAFAGNKGILDAFVYTCRKIWVSLHNKEYRDSHKMTYEEYKDKRANKSKPIAYFFVVGGVFAVLGVLFAVLYYCIK